MSGQPAKGKNGSGHIHCNPTVKVQYENEDRDGKTIHTWHTDQQRTLPLGSPMIMMGFTRDGQLNKELQAARDKRFNISTEEKKKKRADIPMPAVDPMANAWEKGELRQFVVTNKVDSAIHMHQGPPQRE